MNVAADTTAQHGAPVLEAEGLGKRLGPRLVLREVSFRVEPGAFVLLLGNNGAGKTTLVRLLSSLMRPSQGELRFRGRPYARAGADLRRELGVVAHESRLYGELTAEENLHLFGRLYGVEGLRRRVPEVLEEVRLAHVPDVPVRTFSSGMTKRLAIGRLLLYRPSLLLLDEPYAGLDLASQRLLDDYLARFKAAGGTAILTTHQFPDGVSLAGRVWILHQGRLVFDRAEAAPDAGRCARLLHEHSAGPAAAG